MLKLTVKILALSKHGEIILKLCPRQKKNVTLLFCVDLTFEWYEDVIVFRVFIFIFLFRTSGKKGHLDENDFRYCYGNFFESGILKVN